MIGRLVTGAVWIVLAGVGIAYAATNFSTFVSSRSAGSQPLGASDWVAVYQGGTTVHLAGNLLVDTNSVQSISNKTFPPGANTFSIRLGSDVTGVLPLTSGGLGLTAGNSGGIPCFNSASSLASSAALGANLPLIGGGVGACPGTGSFSGNTTKSVSTTGSFPSGQGGSWDVNGNWVANANAVFTNVPQTFTATQIFNSTQGTQNNQSGTTYTLNSGATPDCGRPVYFTSATAVTVTLPNNAPVGCSVQLQQGGAGQLTAILGSGATGGCGSIPTSQPCNPHGFTKTFAQGAVITVYPDTNSGTNAHWVLTGDGA